MTCRPSHRRTTAGAALLALIPGAAALAAVPALAPCRDAPPRLAVVDAPAALSAGATAAPPVCRAVVGAESRVVCLAALAAADGSTRYVMSYWIDGRRVAEWPAGQDKDGGAPAFTLELAELDGNATPTLLLASADELRLLGRTGRIVGPVPAVGWGDRSRALRVAGAARCVLRLDRGGSGADTVHWYRLASSKLTEIPPPHPATAER